MVILADENIEHALITKLKEHFDVISIYDSHRGASDTEIAALAAKQKALCPIGVSQM
jgi:hypothetical protein